MVLLNLSLGELLALLGAVSGLLVALYLLDRSRQRISAATLRFWQPAAAPTENPRRRRRIRQPLSLALQLASMALLLLAIAQLRFGAPAPAARDHVLILDVSAWMAARSSQGRLAEEAQRRALAWVRSLPATDRVMVIRADALATPATRFETDRKVLEEAIRGSEPGWTALDLARSIPFAERLLQLYSGRPGDIVLAGATRVSAAPAATELPSNLRWLPVASPTRNCGLRRVVARPAPQDPSLWEVLVSVRNDGLDPEPVSVVVTFGGRPVGTRRLSLAPAQERETLFELRTRAAGWLEVRLRPGDGFSLDDRALLELPQRRPLRILVCSDRPAWLRPMLAANPEVEAEFGDSAHCDPGPGTDLALFDGVAPRVPPRCGTIWVNPPAQASPLRIRQTVRGAALSWRRDQPLSEGLRSRDLHLETAHILETSPDDLIIAEVEGGPVAAARARDPRSVVIGFDPAAGRLRYELATPLLFANLLNWLAPASFQRPSLSAASPGMVAIPLSPPADPDSLRVSAADGVLLPFTVRDHELRFFLGSPGLVRIEAPGREIVASLTLPETGGRLWQPPAVVRRGIPSRVSGPRPADLWQLLAIAGGAGLLLEWLWFGRKRVRYVGVARPTLPRLRHLLRKAS